jgi:hypothetical protein
VLKVHRVAAAVRGRAPSAEFDRSPRVKPRRISSIRKLRAISAEDSPPDRRLSRPAYVRGTRIEAGMKSQRIGEDELAG